MLTSPPAKSFHTIQQAFAEHLLGQTSFWAPEMESVAPLGWDPSESRGRAGRFRVHPLGNLWATGHFMGKKSLEPQGASPPGTAPHNSPRDQRLPLSHDLLRILLLKKAPGMSLGGTAPHTQVSQTLIPIPGGIQLVGGGGAH
ncbi:neuromedin-B [Ctenodactylus gundi]